MRKYNTWLPECIRFGGDGGIGSSEGGPSNASGPAGGYDTPSGYAPGTTGGFANDTSQSEGSVSGAYGRESTLATKNDGFLGIGGKTVTDLSSATPVMDIDIGSLVGATLGYLTGIPGASKLGSMALQDKWTQQFMYDPTAADTQAQQTLDSFQGDRSSENFKTIEQTIRTAKATAAKQPGTTKDTTATDEQAAIDERIKRLSKGRGGLLYQKDESGVDNGLLSKTLGG